MGFTMVEYISSVTLTLALLLRRMKHFLVIPYINTSGNWENKKLCGKTTTLGQSAFTQFRVFPISTSANINNLLSENEGISETYQTEIWLYGPPQLAGKLAHFRSNDYSMANKRKSFQIAWCEMGWFTCKLRRSIAQVIARSIQQDWGLIYSCNALTRQVCCL